MHAFTGCTIEFQADLVILMNGENDYSTSFIYIYDRLRVLKSIECFQMVSAPEGQYLWYKNCF